MRSRRAAAAAAAALVAATAGSAVGQPRVTGGLTLVTGAGERVRLDGLAPDLGVPALTAALEGVERVVLRGPPRLDRTGHRRVEVFRADGASVQEALVAAGAVRVRPGRDPALTARLLALEAEARAQGRGGWGEGRFRLHAAVPPPGIAGFAIVRGRVVSIGETRWFHYLNFGADYWRDFSVRLRPDDVDDAAWAPEPAALVGRRIEVRGFVFDSGGPMIEVDGPSQLRVLDGLRPPAARRSRPRRRRGGSACR